MDRRRAALTTQEVFRRTAFGVVSAPLCWLALFLFAPLTTMLAREFSWESLVNVLGDGGTHRVLWFTMWQATASTALTFLVAWPVTWACARYTFLGHRIVRGIVTAPFVLPTVVVAASIRAVLPSRLATGVAAILCAHVVFNIAVVVRIVGARWERESADLVDTARTLGMTPMRAFVTLTLPRLKGAVIAAAGVVFVFCFTSYGVMRILGGSRRSTLETEIFFRAVQLGDIRGAVSLSLVQITAVMVVIAFTARHSDSTTVRGAIHAVPVRMFPRRRRLVLAACVITVLFVSMPFVSMFVRSFRTRTGWSTAPWTRLFDGSFRGVGVDVVGAIGNSLLYSVAAAMIALPLALSLASAIAYSQKPSFLTRVVGGVAFLPLATSAVMLGLGIVITFDTSPINWRSKWWMFPITFSVVALPLMVRTLVPAMRAIPTAWRDSAATLGASPLRTWWRIDMRSLRRPIATSVGLCAAVSLGEFGATSFLTRSGHETLPVAIARLLARPGDVMQSSGYALSCVMVIVVVMVMARA